MLHTIHKELNIIMSPPYAYIDLHYTSYWIRFRTTPNVKDEKLLTVWVDVFHIGLREFVDANIQADLLVATYRLLQVKTKKIGCYILV